MKKVYETPDVCIINIEIEDAVLAISGGTGSSGGSGNSGNSGNSIFEDISKDSNEYWLD